MAPVRASDWAAGLSAGIDAGSAITIGRPPCVVLVTLYWPMTIVDR
jgi:hypothetical protein